MREGEGMTRDLTSLRRSDEMGDVGWGNFRTAPVGAGIGEQKPLGVMWLVSEV